MCLSLSFKQVLEQRAVVCERGSKLFGIGISIKVAECDVVSRSVMLHYAWVVYGDVFRSLLEVAHWIAAELHDLADQVIGLASCGHRVVHEVCLRCAPAAGELVALGLG